MSFVVRSFCVVAIASLCGCATEVTPLPPEQGTETAHGKSDDWTEDGEYVVEEQPTYEEGVEPVDGEPTEFVDVTWTQRTYSSGTIVEGQSYFGVAGSFGYTNVTAGQCHFGIFDANQNTVLAGFRVSEAGGNRFTRVVVEFPQRDRAGRHFLDEGYCAQQGGPTSFQRVWFTGGALRVWQGAGTPSGTTADCAAQEWPPRGAPGEWRTLHVDFASGQDSVPAIRATGSNLGGSSVIHRFMDTGCTNLVQSGEAIGFFTF